MRTTVDSMVKVHSRGLLLSTLEKEILLTKLLVSDDGLFIAKTKEWDSYWSPLQNLNNRELADELSVLHSVWRDYVRSGFSTQFRQEFCFRYFSLIDIVLSCCKEITVSSAWLQALQTILGFECFSITWINSEAEVLGSGTSTLRNPCYLLAKLKMPDMLDDPQFLPIITVAGTTKPALFYHYRQYSLSNSSPTSLLLYPAVSVANRSASFKILNSLAGGVSHGIDPRTHERAQRLVHGIIYPILQANKTNESKTIPLEFVDIGAGSGSLTSSLCHQIQLSCASQGLNLKFRLWFVDLEPADPARFFRARRFRGSVDSLTYLGNDYRNWLDKPYPLPEANGLRFAIVSKLLNNLSHFSIHFLSDEELSYGKTMVSSDLAEHLPSRCLTPYGKGVKSLAISNTRVALRDGRTFAQASLSQFYQALWLTSVTNDHTGLMEKGTFLPVRTFNPESLITLEGKSLISRLVENCTYVIIEDADLMSQDIIDHMTAFSLESNSIMDMTRVLGLTGNHAYLIWSKKEVKEPGLRGERIW
jgi:hypothetical protein